MEIHSLPRKEFQDFLKSPSAKGYFIPYTPLKRQKLRIKKHLFSERLSTPSNTRLTLQSPKAKESCHIKRIILISRNKSEFFFNGNRKKECHSSVLMRDKSCQGSVMRHHIITLPSVNYQNYSPN